MIDNSMIIIHAQNYLSYNAGLSCYFKMQNGSVFFGHCIVRSVYTSPAYMTV